ncbi:MAG: ABC transporter ATP-binding protein [Clostridia bacterium]|nr:ABC transporter ATP-binding protein [Clostridia bacterium]
MPPLGRNNKNQGPVKKPKNTKAALKRLMGYISDEKPRLVLVLICVLLSAASNLVGSYMLRPIINRYIVPTDGSAGDPVGLIGGIAVMAAVYLVGVGATYLQMRTMIGVSQRALSKLRTELFTKMQKLPVRFFDTHPTGEVMSRYTNDVDAIGEMLNNTIVQIISGVISITGTLCLMIYTNPWLTLVTLAMAPIMAKVGTAIASHSRKHFASQQKALGDVNGYIEESVTGQKVIKVFCHEDKAIEEFSELNDKLKNAQIRAQFAGGITGPAMNALSQVNYTLTACVGGLLCVLRGFDVGGLTVFVNFSRQFSRPINEFAQQLTTVMSALAGAERVFEVMDAEPEKANEGERDLGTVSGDVVVNNVTFGYNPDKTILKNISIYAHPGQKIALVGSTGAGKTTITNLITRFYDVDDGEITIDGVNIQNITRDCLRRNIAMVLQDTHLFTGTVMENIRYGRPDATDDEVRAAAMTASAHSFIRHLPDGYDTVLEGDGANLSQGQRQLLNIARAALSKAPILVLDEATSSVDTMTEKHINEGMDALMEDRTTFVIAHRLSTVRNADAIMVLENGEIIERGSHDELLERKGRYYELYTGLKELD